MNAPAQDFQAGHDRPVPAPGRCPVSFSRFLVYRHRPACLAVLLLAVAFAPACSRPKTAKYLGMELQPTADAPGHVTLAYTDNALVEFDDGSRIVVGCDMATARQIHPGTQVVLLRQGQSWRIKPMAYPKPAAQAPAAP